MKISNLMKYSAVCCQNGKGTTTEFFKKSSAKIKILKINGIFGSLLPKW
jgi:hypothetical protein